jgi:hypothetical protein
MAKPTPPWMAILGRLDLTEIFRENGHGDIRRWSAKRTIGGAIVGTAILDIQDQGITWPAVVLCAIGVLPLIVSIWSDTQDPGGDPPGSA